MTEQAEQDRRRQPNVLLILTDDQGWGDLSYLGNTNLNTPNIDKLAADGAVMEWFYVQPLCAPTRAEILTGRYFSRTGVKGVSRGAERLNLDEVTIADLFRRAGYATGCFGKWHSGQQYPYHPNGRGFDEFVGFCCGHWSHYFDSTIEKNGVEFKSSGYLPDALTDHAIDFIDRNHEKPFFCYVPLNTPHSPFQVPDEYFNRFADLEPALRSTFPDREDAAVTRAALAMCENIDWNVGRLVQHLEAHGLTENTIVIYLSDNGPNSWRWNGGMAGRKGAAEEGGVRSPCSMTWPGHIPAGSTVSRISGAIDLLPTLADFCDVDISGTKPLDGGSLTPLLVNGGEREDWPDRAIFARRAGTDIASIRTQEFRAGGDYGGLYRISDDIGQKRDLAEEDPEAHKKLMRAVEEWLNGMPDNEIYSALPVGYPEFPHAYIPTQDAVLEGGLERSSVHPNCSYIINWDDPEATLTWDIDVKKTGDYIVTAMYACREQDVGCKIEARFGESRVRVRVTDPFDPPVQDGDDRVPRNEAYEKAFRPLSMGTLRMQKGRGKLVVRCVEKPGKLACDLRALKLELKGEEQE